MIAFYSENIPARFNLKLLRSRVFKIRAVAPYVIKKIRLIAYIFIKSRIAIRSHQSRETSLRKGCVSTGCTGYCATALQKNTKDTLACARASEKDDSGR